MKKIKLYKIIILGLVLIIAGFAFLKLRQLKDQSATLLNVAPIQIDDETINFINTDDNTGESLIIKSDKEYYEGLSEADAYFSITNTGKQAEKTIILFYFPDISVPKNFDGSEVETPTVSSLQKRVGEEWRPISFFANNIRLDEKELNQALSKRKPIPSDLKVKVGAQIDISSGETIYFKSRLSYPEGNEGEFWVEALGDQGGYGLLDPKYGSKASTDTAPGWYSGSWSYRKKITVDEKKVSGTSDLSNFPMLVSMTDSNFKHTSFSGKVASSSIGVTGGGGDFVFTSSNGTTKLDHEIEKYASSSGEIISWVEIPTLSVSQDTIIYMYYGGPSSGATNQNPTGVWDANYVGVYHLKETVTDETTSTDAHQDSTSNNNDGDQTNNDDTSSGKINGAQNLDGTSDYIVLGAPTSLNTIANITYSMWVRFSALATQMLLMGKDDTTFPGGTDGSRMEIDSSNRILLLRSFSDGGAFRRISTGYITTTNTWYHVVGTATNSGSSADIHIYINGVETTYDAGPGATPPLTDDSATNFVLGARDAGDQSLNGLMDEARVSNAVRSLNWAKTEYYNQNRPSTFYSLGGQEARTPTNPGLKIKGGVKFR